MKKKLIQLLMLLVAAVSVGAFVSCKDTNEDYYNELRTQYIKDNATLQEAFDAQVAKLEEQIATYKAALDSLEKAFAGFNSCECDSNALKAVIKGLTDQIESINEQIEILTNGLANAATKEELGAVNHTIDLLTQQVNTIDGALKTLIAAFNPLASDVAAAKAAQEIMQGVINNLQEELRKIREDLANNSQCNCDYNYVTSKLAELEARMTGAEAQAKQALQFATDAKTAADAAKLAAESAQNAADNAKEIAKNAQDLANSAILTANEANRLANEAKTAAETAKQTASDAKDLATAANSLANATFQKVAEFEVQLTAISGKAEQALTQANDAFALAEANHKLIDKLTQTVTSMKSEYDEKFSQIDEALNNLKDLSDKVNDNTGRIKALEDALKELKETTLANLTEKVDEMDKKLDGVNERLATLEAQCASFLEEARLIAQAEVATAKADILNYVMENYVNKEDLENYATKEQLKDSIGALVARMLTELDSDRQRIRANEVDIEWLKRLWSEATYKEIFERITALEGATENIKNEVLQIINETLTEKITEIIKELLKEGGEINVEITKIINNILENGDFITEDKVMPIVNGVIKEVGDENIQDLVQLVVVVSSLNTTVDSLCNVTNTTNTTITTIQNSITTIEGDIETINNNITNLSTRINNVNTRVDSVVNVINNIKGDVIAIQNALAKQVTGIIVQGTYNPWFGSFNLPADIQSNVLVAFYGVPFKDVEFPTDDDQNYIRKDEVLTAKDLEMIDGVEIFEAPANVPLLNEDGNAGKVYMTINPNTADLEGLKLSIVNTLDEESPLKLNPITKSNDKLQFGYSRADNGFYEATTYVTPRIVMKEDNGIAIKRDQILELFNEAYDKIMWIGNQFDKPDGQNSLHKLLTDVYQVIRDLKVDRYGLKCTYTTTDADGAEKEHSVYSQYNLAATFFKPLNLAWGKDFNYDKMPGYDFFNGILNNVAKTLKQNISVTSDGLTGVVQGLIDNLKIEEIKFIGLVDGVIAKYEAKVTNVTLNGVGYVVEAPGTGNFEIKFDKDLTAGGSPVTVPEAVKFDNENITENRATLVVFGDILNGMKLKMLVPARGKDDKVEAYATLTFDDSYATAKLIDGVITLNVVGDESYALAAYAGSSLTITSDCADFVILKDCVGRDGSVYLPVVLELTADLRELLDDQQDILEKIAEELNANLDRINEYGGSAWVDDFVDENLRKYLDMLNKDFCWFVNSINRRFGPFIVASNNGKGFKRLSLWKEYPTKMKKESLAFHPTTKNLELLVPIARKHVAVTNVFKGNASAQGGDADCKAKLQAANTGKLNTVVDGTVRRMNVTGMVPGYIYEVAYSILDFDGNISTVKSYLTIEE